MKPALTPERLDRALDTAARVFDVPRREIAGRCRVKSVARARQAVIAALYRALETSSVELAWRFGRDHSTVLWNIDRAGEREYADADYADRVRLIMQAALADSYRRAA